MLEQIVVLSCTYVAFYFLGDVTYARKPTMITTITTTATMRYNIRAVSFSEYGVVLIVQYYHLELTHVNFACMHVKTV